jgi:phosphoribosylformylglycinamidine cyclo-ligase
MADTFDYNTLDAFKRQAQASARETAGNIGFGFHEIEESRGESAYLVDIGPMIIGHVEEGLGTKNLVAEAIEGVPFSDVAYDTVAMIVNDLITTGTLPVSLAMHLAVGSDDWFKAEGRVDSLIHGWKIACDHSLCAWGPGETPTLRDVVNEKTAVLSGSAWGVIDPKSRRLSGSKIRHDDLIVILTSSGIHANGLSGARKLARKLDKGYDTVLADGSTFGRTLLTPTHIYVKAIKQCFEAGVDLHYAVNITGHGWRKLMRAPQPFRYVIDNIPEPHEIFRFLQEHNGFTDREMYGDYNMGAGFALFMPRSEGRKFFAAMNDLPYTVMQAGTVEECAERRVIIRPKNIEFTGDDLQVR